MKIILFWDCDYEINEGFRNYAATLFGRALALRSKEGLILVATSA